MVPKKDEEKSEFLKKVDEIHKSVTDKGLVQCPKCGNHVKVGKDTICGCGQVKWDEEKKGWIENVTDPKKKPEEKDEGDFIDSLW
jgi:hypothetical protein